MKFSLITPTHSVKYLMELYDSLKSQTYKDWEWVIWLNNGLTKEDLPEPIKADSHTVVHVDNAQNSNVGYLKHHAFHHATGDILVEMDHDDILVDTCLEELFKVFSTKPNIGFAYSNSVKLEKGRQPYSKAYGWDKWGMFDWKGEDYLYMESFPPSSQALSRIHYCPDHVRAWRSDVYRKIGGHNTMLSVCDDHELMIRTYLVTEFYHINKPLYLYRIDGNNTWLQRNKQIQDITVQLGNKYIPYLAERDAELKGLKKIDLGGGLFPKAGYITMDKQDAQINCDLNDRWPLDDNSVGVINASHIIEHLRDPIHTMSEMHRVLCHGGWAIIEVPSTDGRGAWQDPTHVSYWNENSFLYYTRKAQAQFIRNDTIKFQNFRCDTHYPDSSYEAMKAPCVTAYLSCVKQGPRLPHTLEL
jgi:glycosyltransferase involved in cell wall biosynthesis